MPLNKCRRNDENRKISHLVNTTFLFRVRHQQMLKLVSKLVSTVSRYLSQNINHQRKDRRFKVEKLGRKLHKQMITATTCSNATCWHHEHGALLYSRHKCTTSVQSLNTRRTRTEQQLTKQLIRALGNCRGHERQGKTNYCRLRSLQRNH